MSVWTILWWPLGAFALYLVGCFIAGFVSALGIRRRPKFKVVRCEEETE